MSVDVESLTLTLVISFPEEDDCEFIDAVSVSVNERSSIVPACEVAESFVVTVLSVNAPVTRFPLPIRVDSDVEEDTPVMLRSVFASARSCVELDVVVEVALKTPVISFPVCAMTDSDDSEVSLDAF